MSSMSASSARADNGNSTATCTYPSSVSYMAMPSHHHPVGVPHGSDTGRLVLHGHRAGSEARNMPFSNRSRMSAPSHDGFSTSFGAAGEALSMGNRHRMVPGPQHPLEGASDLDMKPNMSYTMPASSTGSMEAAAKQYGLAGHRRADHSRHGLEESPPPPLTHPSSSSPSSSVNDDPEAKEMPHQMLHKCESCSKVYRHPSCLIKHRWEHTMYWKEASKFLMSKHQQVQLLEAAAILVGMDSNARSLPEEKALWPAAVSPPSSGLLGCEYVNFDTLMATKARNAAMYHDSSRMQYGTSAPSASSMPSVHMHASPSKHRAHHALDETVEEGDDSGELDLSAREDTYGLHSGGDVMADMDMDADE